MSTKALSLLKSNKTVAERASQYFKSIKRNIQRDILDELTIRIEKLNEKIFDLGNFSLDINLNQGLTQMTAEDCENRFRELISCKFEITLLEVELKAKQASFDEYFLEEETA